MSNNPFRDLPNTNPYAASTPPAASGSPDNPLLLPAIFLLLLSALFVLSIVASLPAQFARLRGLDMSTPEGLGQMMGGIMPLIMWPIFSLAIALGAISMIRLKNYRNAYTGAVLSVIPLCSPCFLLGIPFGIWAIVVLNRPEVKERFR